MLSLSCKNPRTTGPEISGDDLFPENSSSSKFVVVNNFDLLRHILLCLPVKSLLVFKSVSKRWLSLISDPYFVHNHCLRNRLSIPGFFFQISSDFGNPKFKFFYHNEKANGSHPFKTLNFVNDPAGIKVEQSCNGLLCCSSFRADINNRIYYIYNPSTKHYTVLPKSQLKRDGFVSVCSVSLAFDPLKSNHYEVVCIWRNDKDNYQIEIYYSKTATWRASGYPFPAPDDVFSRSGVFWNGSLHWISLNVSSDWISLPKTSAVFDIGRELLRKMPVPPIQPEEEWDSWRIGYFGENRGHLHLIQIYGPVNTCFDILELENDYSQWTVKYRINLEILKVESPEIDDSDDEVVSSFEFSVLLVEEDEESCKLVLQLLDEVICYDHKEMSFKKIHDISSGMQYEWFDTFRYIESLACV